MDEDEKRKLEEKEKELRAALDEIKSLWERLTFNLSITFEYAPEIFFIQAITLVFILCIFVGTAVLVIKGAAAVLLALLRSLLAIGGS